MKCAKMFEQLENAKCLPHSNNFGVMGNVQKKTIHLLTKTYCPFTYRDIKLTSSASSWTITHLFTVEHAYFN